MKTRYLFACLTFVLGCEATLLSGDDAAVDALQLDMATLEDGTVADAELPPDSALDAMTMEDATEPDGALDGTVDAIVDAAQDAVIDATGDANPTTRRLTIGDLQYEGAFRISSSDFGASSTNYAVGTIGYNPSNSSLFIAGHAQHNMVAEFAIPNTLGQGNDLANLPVVDTALQNFAPVLQTNGNPEGLDKVTGLFWANGDLLINANVWYDAPANTRDSTLVVRGGDLDGTIEGYLEINGAARAAGYMSSVPAAWQARVGAPAITGWASNWSIISRYSVGPSMFAFDPEDARTLMDPLPTIERMSFEYGRGNYLGGAQALEYQCTPDNGTTCSGQGASDLWNFISKAMYGFIVPGTKTFALFGWLGGAQTGIGYKITQDDGRLCGGPCSRGADDHDNYYWFFDVEDILNANDPADPLPYAHGALTVPFGEGGNHPIIGGSYASDKGLLYLSLANAGQVGDFDRPPLIVAYSVN